MHYATVKIDILFFQIQFSFFYLCFTQSHCWLLTPWNLLFLCLPCFPSLCFFSFVIQSQVLSGAPFLCLSLKMYHYLVFHSWLHLTFHGFIPPPSSYVNEIHVHVSSPDFSWILSNIPNWLPMLIPHRCYTDTSTSTNKKMNLPNSLPICSSLSWSMLPPSIPTTTLTQITP